jgi:hypothetical protein
VGQQYSEIPDRVIGFINAQKIFFVGTATSDSRINISPKGMDSFRIIDKKHVVWLNLTGSGNETSAHIQENSRMTIMFSSFDGKPLILRLYGHAKVIHKNDNEWASLISLFPAMVGARQIFDLHIDLVQTSCGTGVPYFDYVKDRDQHANWSNNRGEEGIKKYWEEKNQESLDGIPTNILSKNL